MNTCVLCFSRRKALAWTMRSRSRWNGVLSEHSSSSRRRTAGWFGVARVAVAMSPVSQRGRIAPARKALDRAIRDHFHGRLMTKPWTFAALLGVARPAATATAPSAGAAGVKLTSVGRFDQPLYLTAPPG